jgi:2-dehydropantoate 2-reductase
MRILILGAGGVGGYFGAHLLRSGADVTFLVRERRKALIEANGLQIETPRGVFSVHPKLVCANEVKPEYDLIILAPKSYDLDDALRSLDGASGRGVVLPFLNGMDHLDALDQRFGRAAVMGGVAHIAATITESGAIRQLNDIHSLTVGPRHPDHAELARAFVALCQAAEFDGIYAEEIEQVLWDKWVFLATLAGMTTVCRGSVGEIVATPHGEALTRQMYDACCEVARLSGYPTGAAARERALTLLTTQGSAFTASMLRDLQAGQATEHEHVLGAMSRRGMALGLPMELLRLAHTHLAVQAGRRAGAGA